MSTQATIYNLSELQASYYMNGNYQKSPSTAIYNKFKDLNIAVFLPQRDTALVKKADEYYQRQRNMRLANFAEVHQDRPKTAIERISEISHRRCSRPSRELRHHRGHCRGPRGSGGPPG